MQAERIGPLAIIICKTQARSVEIAKRCLSFSMSEVGCIADSCISVSNENHQFSVSTSTQIHEIQLKKLLIVL